MKNFEITLRKPWILEVGGGIFFAFLLRWTEVLFMIRSLLLPISNWTGLSGAEYIALFLGNYSILGGVIFILVTALTGGVNLMQMGITVIVLVILKFGNQTEKIRNPLMWAFGVLLGMGFLSLKIM